MHPLRRRKKRPNYGVRTVEVCRGKNGFGFTISGQQPCILSCIVSGSPAEKAGLHAGDYLVAVNGQSVSKVPHDDVVRLIGCSSGILKLQIAENYYSDSSDEDAIAPARPRPKYLHKPRTGCQNQRLLGVPQQSRAAKVVRDLRTGAMFEEQQMDTMTGLTRVATKLSPPLMQRWEPPLPVPLPPPRLYPAHQIESVQKTEEDKVEYRALVGYLGTIEMPKELQSGSKLQVVRGCIKRLRAEKRAHTLVLMSVRTRSLTLTNCHQIVLAEYPADRVIFCGSSSDEERRFFGVVTAAIQCTDEDSGEIISSSSCHVFAVEMSLHGGHSEHSAKAEAFKVHCNVDPATGFCQEFPDTSDPIIAAVKVLYNNKEARNGESEEPLVANSPQPSNASSSATTTSSNSDSGIGFRDDCGPHADRILMVDVQNQRLHIQQIMSNTNNNNHINNNSNNNSHEYKQLHNTLSSKSCVYDLSQAGNSRIPRLANEDCSASRLTVRAMPDPVVSISSTLAVSSRSRSPLSNSSSEDDNQCDTNVCSVPLYDFSHYQPTTNLGHCATQSNDDMSVSSGTNKSQDQLNLPFKPKSYEDFTVDKITLNCFSSHYQEKQDIGNCSFSGLSKTVRSTDTMSIGSAQSQDPLLSYKLSPKVFGLSRPVTHSLEDLKASETSCDKTEETNFPSVRGQQWGSLQELRSFVANCFESSPVSELTHSDQETSLEHEEAERGVASWAASFEKLLEDTAGIHTFAEFLKKEFSHENIYFWVACERYREIEDESERKKAARSIFDRHLCLGALEPVNVDSHARQVTQEKLGEAAPDLFVQAQKQIFNLMKFDSYPRFIKSDLYQDCLDRHISGQELPFPGGSGLDVALQLKPRDETSPKNHSKLKKSRSDAEDCRRKSLLPWHRKNRSKSKDRGESEYNKLRMLQQKQDTEDTVSVRSDVTSSRSSLVSWDLALRSSFSRQSVTSGEMGEREACVLCRVILPDGATTVVQTRRNESIRNLVVRLLEKRGLHYSAFEVFTGSHGKLQQISLDDESTSLGNKEVHVEQRVVFRLDLPNRKTVGVKAKPCKTLAEVLRPILNKYGYKLDAVTLCLMSENEVLEHTLPITAVDGQRLQVLTRNIEGWKTEALHKIKSGPTLDEITNRVFEELLQGKADGTKTSDQGSVRSEDWGSEYSSGILGRFLRRDSAFLDKMRESRVKGKKGTGSAKTSLDDSEVKATPLSKAPLISKWKVGAKLQGRSESDELYEGLKRAQRSRLEDQRGTEINSELPDFLKDKENAPQAGKKIRKLRRPDEANMKFGETDVNTHGVGSSHESLLVGSGGNKSRYKGEKDSTANLVSCLFDANFTPDGVLSSTRQTDDYLLTHPSSLVYSSVPDPSLKSSQSTGRSSLQDVVESGIVSGKLQNDSSEPLISARSRHLSDPPPLPPKPKHLPGKASLWGTSNSTFKSSSEMGATSSRFVRPNEVKRDTKPCRSRRAVYLDQPSSSFV